MDEKAKKVKDRFEKIWQSPDFSSFFETNSKRPAYTLKKNTIIFNEGEPLDKLYYIKEGYIKLYRLSDQGRESTIYLYGPGHFLGVRALTSQDECARHNAETITEAKIITMTRKEYLELIAQSPEYLIDLLQVFINRLNYTEKKLEGFILTDTLARVSFFIADCVNRFAKDKKTPIKLPFPLTHQRIAEFVGSFRETITLAVNKLQKEGVLKIDHGKVTILDLNKLNKYAQNY